MFLYNKHFCLVWKGEGVIFNKAIEEKRSKFKIVDKQIKEGNVIGHFEYEFMPNKMETGLTNFFVYDLGTQNSDKARPYCISFSRLNKLSGKKCDLTPYEIEKCREDTIVFDEVNCINKTLDYLLKIKGVERNFKNKIVEYTLQLHVQNGSGLDTLIVLNNLPCDRRIVENIKNGEGIVDLKIFTGYLQNRKKSSPVSTFSMWYEPFKLFIRENGKNIYVTKRNFEN